MKQERTTNTDQRRAPRIDSFSSSLFTRPGGWASRQVRAHAPAILGDSRVLDRVFWRFTSCTRHAYHALGGGKEVARVKLARQSVVGSLRLCRVATTVRRRGSCSDLCERNKANVVERAVREADRVAATMELHTPKRESRPCAELLDHHSPCDTAFYPWNWGEEARNVNLSPGSSCSSPEYREQHVVGADAGGASGRSSAGNGCESHRRGRPRADAITNLMQQGSTSPSSIKCSYCSRVFPREKSLQAHLRTHTGKGTSSGAVGVENSRGFYSREDSRARARARFRLRACRVRLVPPIGHHAAL